MVKKRLIFILYYFQGYFYLSRNFTLQRVGDVTWLIDKFKFKNIGDVIDELIIFNVDRSRPSFLDENFYSNIEKLLENVFVPFAIGGGICSTNEIDNCFRFGCDKVIFSSALVNDFSLIEYTRENYGNQALVINIDYKIENSSRNVYILNGSNKIMELEKYLLNIKDLKPGELILNCISLDGTGFGFDKEVFDLVEDMGFPIIIAGGAGKPEHFIDVLKKTNISAAATGNLFNFLGHGFLKVREYLISNGINIRQIG